MTTEQFSQPKEVSQIDLAFPTDVSKMMPSYVEIPDEFKDHNNKWAKLASTWFFYGAKEWKFYPKSGIEAEKAFRHLSYILGSYEPKHEHKEAGVAYLMSLWFKDIKTK